MKLLSFLPIAVLATAGFAIPAGAAVFTWNWTGVNLEVPDAPFLGDPITVSDTRRVSTGFVDGLTDISDVSVWLRIDGSDGAGGGGTMWNGDLSVRLTHESGASVVLLNRVGRTGSSAFGSAGSGIDLHFDNAALDDVHVAAGSVALSGTYQPDGRSANPSTVTDTSPRDATLSEVLRQFSVTRGSPDGLWTLSVTDLESGGLARVTSWGLVLAVVPEAEDYACLAGAGLIGFALWRRRRAA
jgi:hypothetical protein